MNPCDADPAAHFDRQTDQAIDGDRNASVAMWQDVAEGNYNNELKRWLTHVAEALLDAESKDAGVLRDRAIVRALGLEGRIDKHRDMREFASDMRAFGASRKKAIEMLVNPSDYDLKHWPWRANYKNIDPIDLAKILDRELKKLPKPD